MDKTASQVKKKATPRTKGKGKGKQPKHFLDKDAALDLAAAIAGVQEEKSFNKAEKHHQSQAGNPRVDQKPRISASKVKLKEKKALLAAQRTQIKREKTKRRKEGLGSEQKAQTEGASAGPSTEVPRKAAARKSVSFA